MPTLEQQAFPVPAEFTRMGFERAFDKDFFAERKARLFDVVDAMGPRKSALAIEPGFFQDFKQRQEVVADSHLGSIHYWSLAATTVAGAAFGAAGMAALAIEYSGRAALAMAELATTGFRAGIIRREMTRRQRAERKLHKAQRQVEALRQTINDYPKGQPLPKRIRDKLNTLKSDLRTIVQFEDLRQGYRAGVKIRRSGERVEVIDILNRVADEAEEEVQPDDIIKFDVLSELDSGRAHGQVVSETTRAVHQANEKAAIAAGARTFEDAWVTENDGRVCRICGPLHNTDRTLWEFMQPQGPPAHPNCRCSIKWVRLPATLPHGIQRAAA